MDGVGDGAAATATGTEGFGLRTEPKAQNISTMIQSQFKSGGIGKRSWWTVELGLRPQACHVNGATCGRSLVGVPLARATEDVRWIWRDKAPKVEEWVTASRNLVAFLFFPGFISLSVAWVWPPPRASSFGFADDAGAG